MDGYRFSFACSYLGCIWYKVVEPSGEVYEIECRRDACDYERSIFNGNDEDWTRDVLGEIGLIHRNYWAVKPMPAATVAAFNAWREAERLRMLHQLESNPERYGVVESDHYLRTPLPIVRGARYEIGRGWVVTCDGMGNATAEYAPTK